ncbi:MAG TPA: type II secretion system protein GspK [Spirochaetota bacterium]|nr:type II secretion system protein GspK [Spirochaetota bacterium]
MLRLREMAALAADRFKADYARRKTVIERNGVFSYMFGSSGYVLVIVLIITTLLVSVAGEFILVSQTNINYMRKLQNRLKAGFLAKSGIELGRYVLMADEKGISSEMLTGKSSDKNIDCYNDIWAIQFPPVPLGDEEGSIMLRITDENSKINLSVLSNEVFEEEYTPFYGILQRFMLNMGLPIDFADIMTDWVDIDDSRLPYGAESSDYYQTRIPPYSAKNAEMDSITELLMVKDITPEIYYGLGGGNYGLEENLVPDNRGTSTLDLERLIELAGGGATAREKSEAPEEESVADIGPEKSRALYDYLRVYGKRDEYNNEWNKININTAPFRVLSALTDNMTDDIVSDIISRRRIEPFKTVDDIGDVIDDETVRKNLLTVKSNIFKLTVAAAVDNTTVTVTAFYNRQTKKILYWCEY